LSVLREGVTTNVARVQSPLDCTTYCVLDQIARPWLGWGLIGAFGNIVYCREGTLVLEFMPLSSARPCFYGLAASLGLTHALVEPVHSTFSFDDATTCMSINFVHVLLMLQTFFEN
jgi:hypothetical protein